MKTFHRLLLIVLLGISQLFAQVRVAATVNLQLTNPTATGQFVIMLDGDHAPLSLASFMLLAQPLDETYRNTQVNTGNNPSGTYRAVLPSTGQLILSGSNYTIVTTGNPDPAQPNRFLPGAEAILRLNSRVVATFTLTQSTGPGTWTSDNPLYALSYFSTSEATYPSNNRFQVTLTARPSYLDVFSGNVTSGAYYNNRSFTVNQGSNPTLSLGTSSFGTHTAPGWFLQNEVVDRGSNNMNDPDAVFGDRFANRYGNLAGQGFAVAFANRSLSDFNTAGAQLLISGVNGSPSFRGRHTYLGYVTTDFGGRLLVGQLLAGTRVGTVSSITFQTVSGQYDPTFYYDRLPSIFTKPGNARFKKINDQTFLTTSALKGEVRFIDSSKDLNTWYRYSSSAYPNNLTQEPGLNIDNLINGNARAFFRVSDTVITYPSWPAQSFDLASHHSIRFKGRENDSPGATQVVNNFDISFNNGVRTLVATVGNLAGTHTISSYTYAPSGPYTGELQLESSSFSEPLRLRLYFDAHKLGELPQYSGQNVIDRYHRIEKRTVTIPNFGSFETDAVTEFGIWQIQ